VLYGGPLGQAGAARSCPSRSKINDNPRVQKIPWDRSDDNAVTRQKQTSAPRPKIKKEKNIQRNFGE